MKWRVIGTLFRLAFAALALAVVAPAQAGTLIGLSSSDPGTLYRVDQATGAATLLTDLSGSDFSSFVGLEVLRGTVYATDVVPAAGGNFSFGSIDLNTGAFTVINDQAGSANWHGLAASQADNLLYSVDLDSGNFNLLSVTPTGTVNVIGATGLFITGMAFDDANSILYGVDGSNLYTINVGTGASTVVGALGSFITSTRLGLAYDPVLQALYLNAADGGSLYSVNVSTGAATLIGSNGATAGSGIDGLAYLPTQVQPVPEPSTVVLAGLGGLVLVAHRVRRRRVA
jgi:hypothetical protein